MGGLRIFDISWSAITKILIAFFGAWVLYIVRDSIGAVFLALVISLAFDPIVDYLEKKSIPRVVSALGIFIILLLIVASIVYVLIPFAISEIRNLIGTLSSIDNEVLNLIRLRSSEITATFNASLDQFINNFLSGRTSILDIVGKFIGGIFLAITTAVLSFYLIIGKDSAERFLKSIVPLRYEAYVVTMYQRMERKISLWLLGQLILSACVGFATFLGLTILGVPYSLTLGILAGILEIVPFVGPIFVGALAIIIAFNISPLTALYVLILFIIIQQLENQLLVPVVNRFTTGLSPVIIVISIIVGVKLAGALGMILAVPMAIFITELLSERAIARHHE